MAGLGIVDGWLELANDRGFTLAASEGHGGWVQKPSEVDTKPTKCEPPSYLRLVMHVRRSSTLPLDVSVRESIQQSNVLVLDCSLGGVGKSFCFKDGEPFHIDATAVVTAPHDELLDQRVGATAETQHKSPAVHSSTERSCEPLLLSTTAAQFTCNAFKKTLPMLVKAMRVLCARRMMTAWLAGVAPLSLPDSSTDMLISLLSLGLNQRVDEGTTAQVTAALNRLAETSHDALAIMLHRSVAELTACLEGTATATTSQAVVVESQHEYPNDADLSGTVIVPGATLLTVAFDPKCRTEDGRDILTIADGLGEQRRTMSGDCGFPRWQQISIPGNTLKWNFR